MAQVFHDVACQRCGCVCDDLAVHVEENRLVAFENACAVGEEWIREHETSEGAAALANGQEVALADAIAEAVAILKQSRAPLVCVGSECGVDTQRAAIELAEMSGGAIDPAHSNLHEAATLAFQSVGQSAATLGELRERADLFVFWRSDPVETHPRFFERFVDIPGKFVPDGRADRRVIVVDDEKTATAALADDCVQLSPENDLATIASLRLALKGGAVSAELAKLASAMTECQYGVVCIGSRVGARPDARQVMESINLLVQELNQHTRFVSQVMSGPDCGEVLTWQTGFPMTVSFSEGIPRYRPREAAAETLLERGEIDCLIAVGESRVDDLSPQARENLAKIPVIAIGGKDLGNSPSVIEIPTACDGIHRPAMTFRMDGVSLPLRAVLESSLPIQAEVIRDICEAFQR